MNCKVLTPEAELFNNTVQSAKVPGITGQFEILNNHAPIVSALGEGVITLKVVEGKDIEFQIDQGFVEVLNNEVSLMVTQSNPSNT